VQKVKWRGKWNVVCKKGDIADTAHWAIALTRGKIAGRRKGKLKIYQRRIEVDTGWLREGRV